MRTDLPSMGAGRAAAQASHASNAFIHKYGNKPDVKEWQKQTPQGFGTAIVLGVTADQLTEKVTRAKVGNIPADFIVDTDYVVPISSELVPYLDKSNKDIKVEQSPVDPNKYVIHRREITCGYIFGRKEDLSELLGDLNLYS